MTTSRTVRIARTTPRSGGHAVRLPSRSVPPPAARSPATAAADVRPNTAAVRRANRIGLLYAVALAVLYGGLAAYARAAPGGTTSGATLDLELFGAVAVLLAVAGVAFAVGSAPRRVELRADSTVIVGRFGGRRRFAPLAELEVHVVRRYPLGLLTPDPVEQVEVASKGRGRRRAYLLDEHLLDVRTDVPAGATN